jgi:hypothetical protein
MVKPYGMFRTWVGYASRSLSFNPRLLCTAAPVGKSWKN